MTLRKQLEKIFSLGKEHQYYSIIDIFYNDNEVEKMMNEIEAKFTSSNSDYAKCLKDLYENYPCKDEWDKADIAELLKKHFA